MSLARLPRSQDKYIQTIIILYTSKLRNGNKIKQYHLQYHRKYEMLG